MINANAAIVDPMTQEIFPEGIVSRLLVKMPKGIHVSQLDQFTESLAWFRLKERILLLVFRTKAINVLRNDVKVSPDYGRYFLFGERGESLFQSVHPGQLIHESVRPQPDCHSANKY